MRVKMKTKELIEGSSFLISALDNYNGWLAKQLGRTGPISGTVLEFGCGSGGLTRALASLPEVSKVIANDISPHVKDFWFEKFRNSKKIEFSNANIFESPHLFADMRYDIAVSSNTLEHIEDDVTALKRVVEYSRLKTAILLVPALNCLYGTCDRVGGHYRRYSKKSFKNLAEKCGLAVEELFYFNMLGALCWWFQYVLLRAKDHTSCSHALHYSFFDRFVVPIYSKLERILYCPFGLSLVARVTKLNK